MSNKNTYYERKKENFKKLARNCFISEKVKE